MYTKARINIFLFSLKRLLSIFRFHWIFVFSVIVIYPVLAQLSSIDDESGDVKIQPPSLAKFSGESNVKMQLTIDNLNQRFSLYFSGESECGYLLKLRGSDVKKNNFIVSSFKESSIHIAFAAVNSEGVEFVLILPNDVGVINKTFTFELPEKLQEVLTTGEVSGVMVQVMSFPVLMNSEEIKLFDPLFFSSHFDIK